MSYDSARLAKLRLSRHSPTLYASKTGAVTHTLAEFKAQYGHMGPGQREPSGRRVVLRGRVAAKREASRKLIFYTLERFAPLDGHVEQLQIMCDARDCVDTDAEDWFDAHLLVTRGDVVEVTGVAGTTKKGELSVIASSLVQIESPCLHNLPLHNTLTSDMDTKRRRRHVDMLVNSATTVPTMVARSRIISALRRFVDERGFLEVETPILSLRSGGALATPFQTASDPALFLRIAPELYLKRLIVGGLEGVYEIGKQFRNEGVDKTHVNEFTTMELYRAGWDYEELMAFTEEYLRYIVKQIHPTGIVEGIDFNLPFTRLPIIQAINARCGSNLPEDIGEAQRPELLRLCQVHAISGVDGTTSLGRLIDKLVGHLVEPHCVQPTFLMDHPTVMSPLAKSHRLKGPGVTERFELFIRGLEYVNAYSELNDPEEQLARLVAQVAEGDPESPRAVDFDYVEALTYGLPCCGGWGLGVDRLVMLLTGTDVIDDVIFFPRESTSPVKGSSSLQ